MKQTALEWLVEQMIERKYFAKDVPLSYTTLEHLVNQAKEIEKEQIKDAHSNGYTQTLKYFSSGVNFPDAEQYYNETFKSE
jgi:hypothetical protein